MLSLLNTEAVSRPVSGERMVPGSIWQWLNEALSEALKGTRHMSVSAEASWVPPLAAAETVSTECKTISRPEVYCKHFVHGVPAESHSLGRSLNPPSWDKLTLLLQVSWTSKLIEVSLLWISSCLKCCDMEHVCSLVCNIQMDISTIWALVEIF